MKESLLMKKLIIAVLVMVCVLSFTACAPTKSYAYGPVSGGANASDSVSNNGSFAVTKGDFVYFINSVESTAGKNELDLTYAGALMRANKDGSDAVAIFPKLVTNTSKTGLTILGDRIYFTSPSDTLDSNNKVQSQYMAVMSVKLDGTDAKIHVTLGSSNYALKFVESEVGVLAVYEEAGVLYNYNLSSAKPEKKVLLEKFSSYAIDGNTLYYVPVADNGASNIIKTDFALKNNETVVTGAENAVLTILGVTDGKVFYNQNNSISLENALYVFDANATKISSLAVAKGNVVPYNHNGKVGYIITEASVGTVFYNNNGEKTVIAKSVLSMVGTANGQLIHLTSNGDDSKFINAIDVEKAMTGDKDAQKGKKLLGYADKDEDDKDITSYDGMYIGNFAAPVVSGDVMFFYSTSNEGRQLYAYNFTTEKVELVSINK